MHPHRGFETLTIMFEGVMQLWVNMQAATRMQTSAGLRGRPDLTSCAAVIRRRQYVVMVCDG